MTEPIAGSPNEDATSAHPYEVASHKLIYAFSRQDTPKLDGKLKVGDASIAAKHPPVYTKEELDAAAEKRILSYTGTANVNTELRYTEIALKNTDSDEPEGFRDYDVHRVLLNSNYSRYIDDNPKLTGREWFNDISPENVADAVFAVKNDQDFISTESSSATIKLYPHQESAVEQTLKVLSKGTPESPKKMLWNAKMRFGKTLAAYSFIREASDVKRVLVITHRPDVNSSWFEDFQKFGLHREGWRYGSKRNGNSFEELVSIDSFGIVSPISEGLVWFASMQDLRLSGFGNETFDKNNMLFSMDWDLVITDEAHEGTTTELASAVFTSLKSRYFLDLSGTPYNILAAGDWDITGAERYIYDGVYSWSYMDEQKAKREWPSTNFDEPNPYDVFPEIEFRTYDVDGILGGSISQAHPDFRVSEFLRTDGKGRFIYEQSVLDLMRKLQGDRLYNSIAPDSFPYHNNYDWMFRNTLWILPSVDAVTAMQKLLARSDSGFGGFKVVNATGLGNADASGTSALERVREAVKGEAPSITLSFRMLTTGISVPEWTAVFMMNSATSAMAYMQTAFRAATPYVFPNGSQKSKAYIFDFNVDRSLSAIVEAAKASVPSSSTTSPLEYDRAVREAVDSFLEYAPVLSMSEAHFVAPNSSRILEKINDAYLNEAVEQGFGSPRMLHAPSLKNFDISVVDVLTKLREIQGTAAKKSGELVVSEISPELREKFQERQKELQEKAAAGEPPLSEDESRELKETESTLEKDKKTESKNRKNAISILTGILCRLPMLVLAANTDSEIEPGNFNGLIDEESWREFMPANLIRIKPEGVGSLEERKEQALGDEGSELYWDDIVTFFDPVIFTGACERIRRLARESDDRAPAERAIRMASMFSFFKNPDKETVLTPWRVVNLQYASTVGGLCSVDLERSTSKDTYLFVENIETGELESMIGRAALAAADSGTHRLSGVWLDPGKLSPELKAKADTIVADSADQETTEGSLSLEVAGSTVPATRAELRAQNSSSRRAIDLWAKDELSIYDINSKTALYPLFAALSRFYIRSLELEGRELPRHGDMLVESSLPLESQQEIWREVIEENIFLNCRVDYSVSIAQRVLMGYDSSLKINATVIDVLQLKSTLKWWNAGAGFKTKAGKKLPARLMPEWWKKIADVYTVIGTVLRLATPRFVRYYSPTIIQDRLTVAGYTEEGFQKLLETVLLSRSQGGEQSMGKKSDERSAERLNAVREILEIVDAAKDLPRFDLTAGNPPYQRETAVKETLGQKTVTNVFHEFQLTASELSVATSLVYPAGRWIQRSGKGLDEFGKNQLNSRSLQEVHVWTESSELFSEVGIPDGVSVVFTDSSTDNQGSWSLSHSRGSDTESGPQVTPGEGIIGMSPTENSIVSKASDFGAGFLSDGVTAQKLFGLESNFVEANADSVLPYIEGAEAPTGDYIRILANDRAGKAGRVAWHWIKREDLPAGHSILPKWKLAISSFNTTGFNGRRPYLEVLRPDEAHGRSRLTIATFDSLDEALNAARYLNTSLMRYLASTSGDLLKSYGKNVPLLDSYSSDGPRGELFRMTEEDLDVAVFELFQIDEDERKLVRAKVLRATKLYSDLTEVAIPIQIERARKKVA